MPPATLVTPPDLDARTTSQIVLPRTTRAVFTAGVCLASFFMGAFWGGIAGGGYGSLDQANEWVHRQPERMSDHYEWHTVHTDRSAFVTTGSLLGAAGGLGVGYAWCALMLSRSQRSGRTHVVRAGTLWGIAAGIVSTLLLHLPLNGGLLVIGLLCGIPAGAILGAICGAILQARRGAQAAALAFSEALDPYGTAD